MFRHRFKEEWPYFKADPIGWIKRWWRVRQQRPWLQKKLDERMALPGVFRKAGETDDELRARLLAVRSDPVLFAEQILGQKIPPYQAELMRQIAKGDVKRVKFKPRDGKINGREATYFIIDELSEEDYAKLSNHIVPSVSHERVPISTDKTGAIVLDKPESKG